MKKYKVSKNGNVPEIVAQYADKYEGKPVNKDNFSSLDSDVSFVVVDLKIAHGNTSGDKSAWLCSKTNGGNDWSVRFDIVK